MRLFLAVLLAGCLTFTAAEAQQTPQGNTLRRWSGAGQWLVVLNRLPSRGGKPGCLLVTGYETAGGARSRPWGLRSFGDELVLIVNSATPDEVAANEISLSIDGYEMGRFQVSERPDPSRGIHTAVASVPADRQRRILALLHGASKLRLGNGDAAFEATLDQESAAHFDECRREAELLG